MIKGLVFFCSLLLLSVFSLKQQKDNLTSQHHISLIDVVNENRQKKKRKVLLEDICLNQAAKQHASYLIHQKNLSHFQTNKQFKSPVDRVKHFNCTFNLLLENVAYFEFDEDLPSPEFCAQHLYKLWFKSSGHKENMFHPESTKLGSAIVHDETNKRIIAVQLFAN